MFTTDLGQFDGSSWERLCQCALKMKFASQSYQEVPAIQGDCGIDGYTLSSGDLYQCYCPDQDYPFKELYEAQRDKITSDITKLKTFEADISRLLNGTKIKRWIFLTPRFSNKELLAHCSKKANELRLSGLSFVAPDIQVIVQDYHFLQPELQATLKHLNAKLDYKADLKDQEDLINRYKGDQPSLVGNAFKKHSSRFTKEEVGSSEKINTFVYNTVKFYLSGEEIIRKWEEDFEEQYHNFTRVINNFEIELQDLCLVKTDDYNARYIAIRDSLKSRLAREFGDSLSEVMIDELTSHVIADWILRCPLTFE